MSSWRNQGFRGLTGSICNQLVQKTPEGTSPPSPPWNTAVAKVYPDALNGRLREQPGQRTIMGQKLDDQEKDLHTSLPVLQHWADSREPRKGGEVTKHELLLHGQNVQTMLRLSQEGWTRLCLYVFTSFNRGKYISVVEYLQPSRSLKDPMFI